MGASSSAFIYVFSLYRNRARIRVRILEEQFYSRTTPAIKFEAENLGTAVTSIEPVVRFRGFLPRPKGEPHEGIQMVPYRLEFHIEETAQRTLAPSVSITFTATNRFNAGRDLNDKLGFMFFKTYIFAFTKGRRVKIHIRSADKVILSRKRYLFERVHFALRGVNSLPKPDDKPLDWD